MASDFGVGGSVEAEGARHEVDNQQHVAVRARRAQAHLHGQHAEGVVDHLQGLRGQQHVHERSIQGRDRRRDFRRSEDRVGDPERASAGRGRCAVHDNPDAREGVPRSQRHHANPQARLTPRSSRLHPPVHASQQDPVGEMLADTEWAP
eukprot:7993955-Pyramimonas_sp.AAC.1